MKLFPNFLIFSNLASSDGILEKFKTEKCGEDCKFLEFKKLINWQEAEINENIEVREGKFGAGIFATSDLRENERILQIETEDLITVKKAISFLTKDNDFRHVQEGLRFPKKLRKLLNF